MNPVTIPFLASGLSVLGIVLGVPSATLLILYGINSLRLRWSSRPVGTSWGDNPDAVLLVLKGMTETVGFLARVFDSFGQVLLNALALAAVAGLVFAVALWFTGRGLNAQAAWARVTAFLLLGLTLLPTILLALSVHHVARALFLALAVLCALGLHALWTGYVPTPP